MRLVTFEGDNGQPRSGAMTDRGIVDLAASDTRIPSSVRAILAGEDEILKQVAAAENSDSAVLAPSSAKLLAPIPDPQKVICIGLNYRDHAEESGAPIPSEPVVFCKFPSAIVGPDHDILLPPVSKAIDYEAELVVVIGREGRNISEAVAMDYVAGFTIGHDVSARDWQLEKDGGQWLLGKTFDTFAPIGPALVSRDEAGDPSNLRIALRLNGETMQDSSTQKMIFSIPNIVAYLSQVVTLVPGDLIFTGTPPGVGFARNPKVLLKPGDEVEVEIETLGVLRNRCVSG